MARLTSTHAAPGRPRITRGSVRTVARVKTWLLGVLIGAFELDRVPRPVVYDVGPDLFRPRTGECSPRSLNAAFATKSPAAVCGLGCGSNDYYHRAALEGRETAAEAVSPPC